MEIESTVIKKAEQDINSSAQEERPSLLDFKDPRVICVYQFSQDQIIKHRRYQEWQSKITDFINEQKTTLLKKREGTSKESDISDEELLIEHINFNFREILSKNVTFNNKSAVMLISEDEVEVDIDIIKKFVNSEAKFKIETGENYYLLLLQSTLLTTMPRYFFKESSKIEVVVPDQAKNIEPKKEKKQGWFKKLFGKDDSVMQTKPDTEVTKVRQFYIDRNKVNVAWKRIGKESVICQLDIEIYSLNTSSKESQLMDEQSFWLESKNSEASFVKINKEDENVLKEYRSLNMPLIAKFAISLKEQKNPPSLLIEKIEVASCTNRLSFPEAKKFIRPKTLLQETLTSITNVLTNTEEKKSEEEVVHTKKIESKVKEFKQSDLQIRWEEDFYKLSNRQAFYQWHKQAQNRSSNIAKDENLTDLDNDAVRFIMGKKFLRGPQIIRKTHLKIVYEDTQKQLLEFVTCHMQVEGQVNQKIEDEYGQCVDFLMANGGKHIAKAVFSLLHGKFIDENEKEMNFSDHEEHYKADIQWRNIEGKICCDAKVYFGVLEQIVDENVLSQNDMSDKAEEIKKTFKHYKVAVKNGAQRLIEINHENDDEFLPIIICNARFELRVGGFSRANFELTKLIVQSTTLDLVNKIVKFNDRSETEIEKIKRTIRAETIKAKYLPINAGELSPLLPKKEEPQPSCCFPFYQRKKIEKKEDPINKSQEISVNKSEESSEDVSDLYKFRESFSGGK